MRRRWQRQIQSVRQSLSWLRASQERLRGVEYDVSVRESQARALGTVAGGACGVGGGLAQSCRPWIRVYSDRVGAFADSNLVSKSLLGAPDFRLKPREFCTSSIGDEHMSNEIGRENDRALRREKEQEEIVGRFENLLSKWSSNTPLLLSYDYGKKERNSKQNITLSSTQSSIRKVLVHCSSTLAVLLQL